MIKYGFEFIALMLVFGRMDIILDLSYYVRHVGGFTSMKIPYSGKVYQYTEFIRNCFIAPKAGINTTRMPYASWQLDVVTGINYVGVLLLVLVVISAILNYKKKSSQLAFFWIVFSMFMLVKIGWGISENGLILYSLYFGWAYLVLLFQLVQKIEAYLKVKWILPAVSTVCAIVMTVINIPAIMEMIDFAMKYYPA